MKKLLTCLTLALAALSLTAQKVISADKYNISFEAPEALTYFQLDSDSLFGYDNDNYSVIIEVVPLDWESDKFLADLKFGAKEIATDMGFKKITQIGKLPAIKESYYVSATMKDDLGIIPVYVIAIIDAQRLIAFEISVYCYNLNMTAGEDIVKSFRFID